LNGQLRKVSFNIKNMKPQTQNILVSDNPKPFVSFKQQAIICISGSKKYIKSFNVLLGEKRLKKVYLPTPILLEPTTNIEHLIVEQLFKVLLDNQGQKSTSTNKRQKAKKKKVDNSARREAAKNLFADLGL
jgi:hypothetical protein